MYKTQNVAKPVVCRGISNGGWGSIIINNIQLNESGNTKYTNKRIYRTMGEYNPQTPPPPLKIPLGKFVFKIRFDMALKCLFNINCYCIILIHFFLTFQCVIINRVLAQFEGLFLCQQQYYSFIILQLYYIAVLYQYILINYNNTFELIHVQCLSLSTVHLQW